MSAGDLFLGGLTTHRLTPTAITASSEQGAYPAVNVDDFLHPLRPWKAATTDVEWIKLAFGAAIDLAAIYVGWIGIDSELDFSIQANLTDDWTAPLVDQLIPGDLAYNPLVRRYGYAYVLPEILQAAYVRVLFPGHSGTAVSVGQLLAVTEDVGQRVPNRPGISFGKRQRGAQNSFEGGGAERLSLGVPQMTLGFSWEWAYNYLETSELNETDVLLSPQVLADYDDALLVVPDLELLPHRASIFRPAAGGDGVDMTIQSDAGIGARLALAYEEVIG